MRYLLIPLFFASVSVHASGIDPYKILKLGQGTLHVITQNSEVCSDGPLKLVGSKGEEVLMVGPIISFPLKSEIHDNELCKETTEVFSSDKKILSKNTISHCPKEHKSLESVVEESLTNDGNILIYERKSGDSKIRCTFKWTAGEKK